MFMNDAVVDHSIHQNKREAWMPKGDIPYYDPVAQRTFQSRAEKRLWLKRHGMRETGSLVNPSKHVKGRERTRFSAQDLERRKAIKEHIRSVGGVNGLLDRLAQKERY